MQISVRESAALLIAAIRITASVSTRIVSQRADPRKVGPPSSRKLGLFPPRKSISQAIGYGSITAVAASKTSRVMPTM
jgi:hypothetical protein